MEITSKEEVRQNTIAEVKVDVSFRKIKKNAVCFHIWRIEDGRLEAESKDKYGTFMDDGAYIIYAACTYGAYVNQDTITRETKDTNLERYIHFWLGEHVSEEKRSNVTHKIQELDSYFNNVATEYRETQNNESARFMSYFKRGINILSSALLSTTDTKRLYQAYGRKYFRIIETPNISWQHFYSDYVMLLKLDAKLFIWFGRSSSKMERRQAMEWACNKLRLNSSNIVILDDGYEQGMPVEFKSQWNTHLPLNERSVAQSAELALAPLQNFRAFKCGYKAGRLYLDQLNVTIPTKDNLKDSTAVYVLDAIPNGIWMWVGNQAAQEDSISAMGNGRAYVKKKKYPYTTPVMRVVEGHEPLEFERLFVKTNQDWTHSLTVCKPVSSTIGKLSSMMLSQRPKMAADMQLIDDGSGQRNLYCITADFAVEMSTEKIVKFETDKCYVMEYSVVFPTTSPIDAESVGVQSIIYQWNGTEAKREALQKCNNFAMTCFEKFTDKVMYVQMHEFEETPHFLQIFDGKLIVLQNSKSDYALHNGNSLNGTERNYVLKVCGDATYNSKAIEICVSSSLSSRDCYVVNAQNVWVWCGQSSTGDLREVAKSFGALHGEYTLVLENKEPVEFWNAINCNGKASPPLSSSMSSSSSLGSNGHMHENGGRSPINSYYSTTQSVKVRAPPAQLFLVWANRQKFHMQEILNFDQTDLAPESVFVLDTGSICFIWLGQYADKNEKRRFMDLAHYYLDSISTTRRLLSPICVIRQFAEPNIFKGLFNSWNNSYWNNLIGYEEKRQSIGINADNGLFNGKSSNSGDSSCSPVQSINTQDFDSYQKYALPALQRERDALPDDVDPLKRELHLTHDDFVNLFNMPYWDFEELPKWKKQELKKKHKLF